MLKADHPAIQGLEKGIEGGLLFILAGAPLALGSVYTLTYGMVQMLTLFLFFLWGIRRCLLPQNRGFLTRHPFVIPFIFWMGLVLIQMIPLGSGFLRNLSPETLRIYETILGMDPAGRYPLSLSVFDTWRALLQVVTGAILFYLVTNFSPSRKAKARAPTEDPFFNSLLFVAALTAGFQALYGLAEYFTGHQRIFFFQRLIPVKGAAGTFVSPNHFANYLLLFFPLLFSWMVQARSFRGQQVFLMATLALMTAALAASHSRMALFTFLIEAFLLGAGLFFSDFRPRALALLFILFLGGMVFVIFLDPGFAAFQNRVSVFFQGKETDRLQFWKDGFQIARDFPWIGTGLGTFQLIFPKYSSVPITSRLEHAHNEGLELLVETGIFGSCLVALSGVWFFVTFLRRLQRMPPGIRPLSVGILIALLAFGVHSTVEFNFHIPANAFNFAMVLGMGLRLNERREGGS